MVSIIALQEVKFYAKANPECRILPSHTPIHVELHKGTILLMKDTNLVSKCKESLKGIY